MKHDASQPGPPADPVRARDQVCREVAQVLRAVDPRAFLIAPRVLRRVIRLECDLAGFAFQVPHRKLFVVAGDRLPLLVATDELGGGVPSFYPPQVILIGEPEFHERSQIAHGPLERHVWRMLFHGAVHVELDQQRASGRLSTAAIRARIHELGQTAFDEVRSVLRREQFLLPPVTLESTWVEFAALFLELRQFSPRWLPAYFPALDDLDRVAALLARDLDANQIFQRTRIPGADESDAEPDPPASAHIPEARSAAPASGGLDRRPAPPPAPGVLPSQAARASRLGNQVRAALVCQSAAARSSHAEQAALLRQAARHELSRLAQRLADALQQPSELAERWQPLLEELLHRAGQGFWNPDARLLYDLQTVCIDHERPLSKINLLGWIFSLGRTPMRRPLPNSKPVRICRRLLSARKHLLQSTLPAAARARCAELLSDAHHRAEERVRAQLRPLIVRAFDEVGLRAANLPERVSLKKLQDELLDDVAERGFLDVGRIRDALSRNQLKLHDLAGLSEFLTGDELLRLDRRLQRELDGVYQAAPFYLRLLQWLTSAAFGTPVGRLLTRCVALPFGGAYLVLKGIEEGPKHPLEFIHVHYHVPVYSVTSLITLGTVFLGLIQFPALRRLVVRLLKTAWEVTWSLLVTLPRRILAWNLLHDFLASPPIWFFRRYLLNPLALTAVAWKGLPWLGLYAEPGWPWGLAILIASLIVLNSRFQRDLEEFTAEWFARTWHRIRVQFFIALFDFIMELFKEFLDAIERMLYAVDEWLRFRQGEAPWMLGVKGVLGLFWSVIEGVVRFCVTLLIEPQVNPIKHFPVVTVSHKLLLPTIPLWAELFKAGPDFLANNATYWATSFVFMIPGVFGFMVWELKENWRLYAANRPEQLPPVRIGHHGETLATLLRPGFHRGPIPATYHRLRRAERQSDPAKRERRRQKLEDRLHHELERTQRFFERELIALLRESPAWTGLEVAVTQLHCTTNSLTVSFQLRGPGGIAEGFRDSFVISFHEQSGYLVAGIVQPGWIDQLTREQRLVLRTALAGTYRMGCVDLVREQIAALLPGVGGRYDISAGGLTLWPDAQFEHEVHYALEQSPTLTARPRTTAKKFGLGPLVRRQLLYRDNPLSWQVWVEVWESGDHARFPERFPAAEVLPGPKPGGGS